MRPGTKALSLLSTPLHVDLLNALESGPLTLKDLAREAGLPPQSTMRVYMRQLSELGVLERRQLDGFPGSVEFGLTPTGRKLLQARDVLARWLHLAPNGPIALGSATAKSATKALLDGWDVQLIRALAARPLALTQLSRLITVINYPTLERRLGAMRAAGLLQPCADRDGRAVPYEVSDWLRAAAVPLAAAAGWERRFIPELTAPFSRNTVEAFFLLTVPCLRVPMEATGTCRLAVVTRNRNGVELAGVDVRLSEGWVSSCSTRLEGPVDATATGSLCEWYRWINRQEPGEVERNGDVGLAEDLIEALRSSLFERAVV